MAKIVDYNYVFNFIKSNANPAVAVDLVYEMLQTKYSIKQPRRIISNLVKQGLIMRTKKSGGFITVKRKVKNG